MPDYVLTMSYDRDLAHSGCTERLSRFRGNCYRARRRVNRLRLCKQQEGWSCSMLWERNGWKSALRSQFSGHLRPLKWRPLTPLHDAGSQGPQPLQTRFGRRQDQSVQRAGGRAGGASRATGRQSGNAALRGGRRAILCPAPPPAGQQPCARTHGGGRAPDYQASQWGAGAGTDRACPEVNTAT